MGGQLRELGEYIQEHCTREHLAHVHFIALGLAGMKILFTQIIISGVLFLPFTSFAAGVKSVIGVVEETLNIRETDMYTMIHAWELSQELRRSCAPSDISTAQEYVRKIQGGLEKAYGSMSEAQMLLHSWRLYEAIDTAHPRLQQFSDSDYCALKYIFYSMQDRLRDEHVALLEESGIDNDFGTFGSSEKIYASQIKIDTLDLLIEENKKYQSLLGVNLAFKRVNNTFKDTLSEDARNILVKNEVLMALIVYKSLHQLQQAGLFTASDIQMLQDKISFEFVDNCQNFHGKYEIRETIDGKGHHVAFDTQNLRLKVNLCGNYFILRDIAVFFEKIVTHELGHHFYYYRDTKAGAFEDICWSSNETRNANCRDEDFVSDYAKTLAIEDYAEHFMHWFLGLIPESTTILDKKSLHFESYR